MTLGGGEDEDAGYSDEGTDESGSEEEEEEADVGRSKGGARGRRVVWVAMASSSVCVFW